MFDIIDCEADPKAYGFERFFHRDRAGILQAKDLQGAALHKNRKSLVMLADYAFDEGAIKLIADKKRLCFVIDIGEIIRTRGVPRAILMSKLRTFLRLCNKHGAFYTFATFSKEKGRIRTPRELIHIAWLLGLNKGQAVFALDMLQHYLKD